MLNESPVIHEKSSHRSIPTDRELNALIEDPIDSQEIFELICDIYDPEHTDTTLEELNVVRKQLIKVDNSHKRIHVQYTPTIPHCSMATVIGLCIKVMLLRSVSREYKISIKIEPGTHVSESEINKQLNDKERIAAAIENPNLLAVVNKCLSIKWNFDYPMYILKNGEI